MATRRKNSPAYWWIGALFAVFAASGIVDQLASYADLPKWWGGYVSGAAAFTVFWLAVLFTNIRLSPRPRGRR